MAGDRYPIEMVGGVPVVAAAAEIDASNADWLQAVLEEAACRGHGTFVVDMTGTQFCGSAGLTELVRAHNRVLAEGGELRLVIPASAMVARIFEITGIDQAIPNFPTLDEALTPPPAAAPRPRRQRRRQKPGMRTRADPRRPIPVPSPARPDGTRSGARLVPAALVARPRRNPLTLLAPDAWPALRMAA